MEYDKKSFNGVRVCDALKRARTDAGLSQKALAECLGYSQSGYNAWESGNREPPVAVFLTILEMCGTSVSRVFGVTDEQNVDAEVRHTTLEKSVQGAKNDIQEDITEDAKRVARKYSQLDVEGRAFVWTVLEHETVRVVHGVGALK